MESRFACFYLTRQLEWILRKFQLAEVVLVVSKPHVFNLTGQLVSTPPECSTLAATDPLELRNERQILLRNSAAVGGEAGGRRGNRKSRV